ncbi:MAG: AIR synthase related protein [Nitrososphaerales archaeon]|nr:AIR synthase related protein [Nitrososphaerales archaeon]
MSPSFLEKVILRNLGAVSARVLLGPGRGLDNAVISIGKTRRMILTSDPVSIIPSLGMETSAWLSVHLVASDYATSGLRPQFATFTFNLPGELKNEDAAVYLRAIGKECRKLRMSIVAGHTGTYPGGAFTVVGGGTMFGFCREGDYVDPSMARTGDAILMTKGAAIEATAYLALSFPKYIERKVGSAIAGRAKALVRRCSTVADALTASSIGLGRDGVTSMHDATEGGVLGGLDEMMSACGKAAVIEREMIHVPEECEAVCGAFGIDPLNALSEGTLLITCNPSRADDLLKAMRREGIATYGIGHVTDGNGLWVSEHGGSARRTKPRGDGYWKAYRKSVESELE